MSRGSPVHLTILFLLMGLARAMANPQEEAEDGGYQEAKKPPESFSSLDMGWVTDAKDQGSCDASAVFASIAVIEVCMAKLTGEMVSLSEQQLIDCATVPVEWGCRGGLAPREYLDWVVAKNNVLALEEDYKYEDTNADSTTKHQCRSTEFPLHTVKAVVVKAPRRFFGTEEVLMELVAKYGAAAVSVRMSNNTLARLRNHREGVFQCTHEDDDDHLHSMAVVGYGTENGEKYWLVKNSWGTDVGENGLSKWARGENDKCYIASSPQVVECQTIDECRKNNCLKGPEDSQDDGNEPEVPVYDDEIIPIL